MIEFKDVSIGYKSTVLFSIENFSLDSGHLYILIGKNGSGKSTLLKTIVGNENAIKGKVLIDGQAVGSYTKRELAQKVSLVQSTFPITDYLRVYDFISLGRSPYTNALGRLSQKDKAAIDSAIQSLNIGYLTKKFTSDLSDGERQLVSIAKALCQDTALILLDEPTAFLDYSNKTLLHTTLKRIAKENNKCIILSSHDLELSLETESDFLAVNSNLKTLDLIQAPTNKERLISTAFH